MKKFLGRYGDMKTAVKLFFIFCATTIALISKNALAATLYEVRKERIGTLLAQSTRRLAAEIHALIEKKENVLQTNLVQMDDLHTRETANDIETLWNSMREVRSKWGVGISTVGTLIEILQDLAPDTREILVREANIPEEVANELAQRFIALISHHIYNEEMWNTAELLSMPEKYH